MPPRTYPDTERITGFGYATSPNWNQLFAQRMAEISAQEAKNKSKARKAKTPPKRRRAVKP